MSKVYFKPVKLDDVEEVNQAAAELLDKFGIEFKKDIHP